MSRKLTRIAVLGVLLCSAVGVFRTTPRVSAAAIGGVGAGSSGTGWMVPDGHWHSTVEVHTVTLADGSVHTYQVTHTWRAFRTSRILSRAEVAALMASPDTAGPTPDLTGGGGGGTCNGVVDVYNQWHWADFNISPQFDRVETQLHSSDNWNICNNTVTNNFLDGMCDNIAPNATCDTATGNPHIFTNAPAFPQSVVDAADFSGSLGGLNGNYFCHMRTYINAAGSYNFNGNDCQ